MLKTHWSNGLENLPEPLSAGPEQCPDITPLPQHPQSMLKPTKPLALTVEDLKPLLEG
jgi:hypothetical protein